MKNTLQILLLVAVCLLSSCAKKVTIPMQENSANTGTIKVKPSRPIAGASVTVDGNLVWERKRRIKSVTFTNVPKGKHDLQIVSASWYYKEAINHKEAVSLRSGDNKTVLVSVPPYSTGYYFYWTAIMLVCCLPAVFI
jgi:hypothetical protein